MRATLLIILLVGKVAFANPKFIGPPPLTAYIGSEKLVVSMTPTDANFTGCFAFSSCENLLMPAFADQWRGIRPTTIQFYIWFPEEGNGDARIEEFWRTFRKGDINVLTTNVLGQEVFERSIGLRISVGERQLKIGWEVDSFIALPYRPIRRDHESERLLSELLKSMPKSEVTESQTGGVGPGELDEPGYCLLVLGFRDDGAIVRNQTPVKLTYRQPLAPSKEGARTFYQPVFENLPDGRTTADTNQYSITFVAQDCSLLITNGAEMATVESGNSLTLAPRIHQPFRVISRPGP